MTNSDFYFAIFAIMAASTVIFSVLLFGAPRSNKTLQYLFYGTVVGTSIAYLSSASNSTLVHDFTEFSSRYGGQVSVARYIDWFVTTPLILVDLMVLAGLPWSTIFYTVVVNEIMVGACLYGASSTSYSFIPFGFGCLCYLYIAHTLIFKARKSAREVGADVHRLYVGVAVWTAALWTLYPRIWGFPEAGNLTSVECEAVFYGVLDLLAKPVCGLWLLTGNSVITSERAAQARQQALTEEKRFKMRHESVLNTEDAQFLRQLRE